MCIDRVFFYTCGLPLLLFEKRQQHCLLSKYQNVVKLYGGKDALAFLSLRIRRERRLFYIAVQHVSCTACPAPPNLLAVILDVAPYARKLCCHHPSVPRNAHSQAIYEAYIGLGGDPSIVLYGLLEYLLMESESDDITKKYLSELTDPACSALRMYVMTTSATTKPAPPPNQLVHTPNFGVCFTDQ